MTTKTHISRTQADGQSVGASPFRATVGGLSILLVVALALQAGVGARVANAPCNDARAAQARVMEIVPTLIRQDQRPDPTDSTSRLPGMRGPISRLAIGCVGGLPSHAASTGASEPMDWRSVPIVRESKLPPPRVG